MLFNKRIYTQQCVRDELKLLTTEQLTKGMKAFSHPPRGTIIPVRDDLNGDSCGCFLHEALGALESYFVFNVYRNNYALGADVPVTFLSLSDAYEGFDSIEGLEQGTETNKWFHGECIRELAERGVVYEANPNPETSMVGLGQML